MKKIKLVIASGLLLFAVNRIHAQGCNNAVVWDDYTSPWTIVDPVENNGEVSNADGVAMHFTAGEWDASTSSYVGGGCLAGAACARDIRSYRAIGTTLSNTSWRAVCKINVSGGNAPSSYVLALTAGTDNPHADGNDDSNFGTSPCSGTQSTAYTTYNQDMIGVALSCSTNPTSFSNQPFGVSTWSFIGTSKDGTTTGTSSTPITLPATGTDYWICLERLSETEARLSIYSNSGLTTHVSGSPQCFTISSGITGLTHVQHAMSVSGGFKRSLSATIDNLRIYNECPGTLLTASSSPSNVCQGETVTLSATSGFSSYTWSPGGATTNPATVTSGTPGTYTYTVSATMPGSCVLQASTTFTVSTGLLLHPQFAITLTPVTGGINATATPVSGSTNADIAGDATAGYTWEVQELDLSTGAVISSVYNPSAWMSTASTESFGGYPGTPSSTGMGFFQDGHKYRIIRGVWSGCTPYTTYGYDFIPCSTCRMANGQAGSIVEVTTQQAPKGPLMIPTYTHEGAEEISVFPNPSKGLFHVTVPASMADGTIEVISLLGDKVIEAQPVNGRTQMDIDLGSQGVAPGVYFIRCTNGNEMSQQRLVITE